MMKRLIPTTILAVAVTACGGADIDKVKADFENPSGSTQDKNGVIAANGKQQAAGSNSALSLAGGGVPGLGLSTTGSGAKFAKISPRTVFGSKMVNIAAAGLKRSELRVAQSEASCFDSSELEEKSGELQAAVATGGKAEASVSMSVNMADCDPGMSGSLDLDMNMKVDGAKISYDVEYTFSNVCETASGDCVDGAMAQEAFIDFSSADMTNLFGSIKSVSAWDLTATYTNEKGVQETITSKGGLRIGFSSNAGGESAEIEYLNYVKSSSGEEVSYVLTLKATTGQDGKLTISIRGSDGSLECTFTEATGEGMCTDGNGNTVSWTEAEYSDVTSSDDFKG